MQGYKADRERKLQKQLLERLAVVHVASQRKATVFSAAQSFFAQLIMDLHLMAHGVMAEEMCKWGRP